MIKKHIKSIIVSLILCTSIIFANEYYTKPSAVAPLSRAKSAKINEIIDSVDAGFDNIPAGLDALVSGSGVVISANDTGVGYLNNKLLVGDVITKSIGNPGADETLTLTIPDDGITYAKIQNVVSDQVLLGRISGAAGIIEELTKTQALSLLNVEDGADVTDAENIASSINGTSGKTPVVDSDRFALTDSEDSNALNYVTWANINSTTATLTNKTLTSPALNISVSGTAVKNEDDMASDSDTAISTQQSIKAYVDSSIPAGSYLLWPTDTPPAGYLECDGSSLLRAGTYVNLFAVIGTLYGTADGTHFNLPDLRGQFLRSWDNGAGIDPNTGTRTVPGTTGATITAGDHVGTEQADQNASHNHNYTSPTGAGSIGGGGATPNAQTNSTTSSGGDEARPTNTNVMVCIKY